MMKTWNSIQTISTSSLFHRVLGNPSYCNHIHKYLYGSFGGSHHHKFHSTENCKYHRPLSYYVPVSVRRRQRLEALKSLREALHADTLHSMEATQNSPSSHHTTAVSFTNADTSNLLSKNMTTSSSSSDSSSLSSSSTGRPFREPTLDIVQNLPTSYRQMDNMTLIILSSLESPPIYKARAEVLRRHVMCTDQITYTEACTIVESMEEKNRTLMPISFLPHKIGMALAMTGALASFPLVFDYDTVSWFNQHFVTADIPDPKDLETWLEVGGWAWNWMEPVMGQVSFVLLCLQFTRAQMQNLGLKPYTEKIATIRANRLCKAFPKYDKGIVTAFSKSIHYYY